MYCAIPNRILLYTPRYQTKFCITVILPWLQVKFYIFSDLFHYMDNRAIVIFCAVWNMDLSRCFTTLEFSIIHNSYLTLGNNSYLFFFIFSTPLTMNTALYFSHLDVIVQSPLPVNSTSTQSNTKSLKRTTICSPFSSC